MAKAKVAAAKAAPAVKRASRERMTSLVIPSYSLKGVDTGTSLFVECLTELYSKEDYDNKTGERRKDKAGEPAFIHLMQVRDMDTAEIGEMVIPILIYNAWQQAGALAGRCFELVKGKAEANKATKWEVYEVAA